MTTGAKQATALIAHLLRRAGFGATYDELERYARLGYEATVEELLHPEKQPVFVTSLDTPRKLDFSRVEP